MVIRKMVQNSGNKFFHISFCLENHSSLTFQEGHLHQSLKEIAGFLAIGFGIYFMWSLLC